MLFKYEELFLYIILSLSHIINNSLNIIYCTITILKKKFNDNKQFPPVELYNMDDDNIKSNFGQYVIIDLEY